MKTTNRLHTLDSMCIPLTGGGEAIVDCEDYEKLIRWKWRRNLYGYAYRRKFVGYYDNKFNKLGYKASKYANVMMHRAIMNAPDGVEIDHINRNPCDNRKTNLRFANRSLNNRNRKLYAKSKSGYTGVTWDKSRKLWRACMKVSGQSRELGRFANLEDAIAARKLAEKEIVEPLWIEAQKVLNENNKQSA